MCRLSATRRGPALVAGALAAAVVVASAARVHAAAPGADTGGDDTEQVSLRAELGAEYDSNAHRHERLAANPTSPVASPLVRAVLGWSASDRIGSGQDVAFSLLGAGKIFTASDAQSENVAIVESGGMWRLALGARNRLALSGAYYEAVQAGTAAEREVGGDARDFRSLAPLVRLARSLGASGAGVLSLAAGFRWFVYKPLRAYDFSAPMLSLQYQLTHETADGAAEWEIVAAAGAELRRFAGVRLLAGDDDKASTAPITVPDPTGVRHEDQFVSGQIEVTRTGSLLVGLGYAAQWNRSNSYAETVLRHIGIVRLTAPLPLDVYLAARAEVVFARYADPVALAIGPSGRPSATFEDENRNQIRAELSRALGGRLQIIVRGALYTNAVIGAAGSSNAPGYQYRRLTTTLSLAFSN